MNVPVSFDVEKASLQEIIQALEEGKMTLAHGRITSEVLVRVYLGKMLYWGRYVADWVAESASQRSQRDHYGAGIPLGSAETRKSTPRADEVLNNAASLTDCKNARRGTSTGEIEGAAAWSSTAIPVRPRPEFEMRY